MICDSASVNDLCPQNDFNTLDVFHGVSIENKIWFTFPKSRLQFSIVCYQYDYLFFKMVVNKQV